MCIRDSRKAFHNACERWNPSGFFRPEPLMRLIRRRAGYHRPKRRRRDLEQCAATAMPKGVVPDWLTAHQSEEDARGSLSRT
eukprot:366566-Amphidinium_carterae.1